jgi:hypothetical protein
MGLQMKIRRLACPNCGRTYLALFFRSRSTCPHCRADVQTELKTVGIIETIIGLPVIWLAGAFLRIHGSRDRVGQPPSADGTRVPCARAQEVLAPRFSRSKGRRPGYFPPQVLHPHIHDWTNIERADHSGRSCSPWPASRRAVLAVASAGGRW